MCWSLKWIIQLFNENFCLKFYSLHCCYSNVITYKNNHLCTMIELTNEFNFHSIKTKYVDIK